MHVQALDTQLCLVPQSALVQQAELAMHPLPHLRVVPLQLKSQVLPLQVAVLLAGCGHGLHDVVPQLAVLLFDTHTPLQL